MDQYKNTGNVDDRTTGEYSTRSTLASLEKTSITNDHIPSCDTSAVSMEAIPMKPVSESAASTVASPANGKQQEEDQGQGQTLEQEHSREMPFFDAKEGQKPLPISRFVLLGIG